MSSSLSSRQNLAVDTIRGELLCPLCKNLSHALLPYTPTHLARRSFKMDSDGIPDSNYTNKLRDLWKGVVTPSSDMKVAAEENDAGAFSMTNIMDKIFPLPDSTVASDSPVTAMNENENENEVDLVNRLQLCTHSKTFAENCLAQYQLSFRRKVPIDLKPPCETLTNMRALHCTWSALAYTLYSNSSVWRWTDDDIHADVVDRNASRATEERKAIELGMHVMFAARNAVNWMGRFDFRGAVLVPMRRLLSGASLCRSDSLSTDGVLNGVMRYSRCVLIETAACLENECEDILLSLPTKTVGTPGFPNPKRILATLAICRNKGVAETKLWPVLSQPLLLQDLSVIAVAAVCSCSNLFGSLELIALFGIARLAQLLIEPTCNGSLSLQNTKQLLDRLYANTVNTGISIINLQSDFYYHLNSIRDRMCGTCGIPVTSVAPKDSDLLLIIIDSWIPFLQFLNLLRKVVLFSNESFINNNSNNNNINSNAQDIGIKENILNDGTGELQGLLLGIGIPSLPDMIHSESVWTAMKSWGEQLDAIYRSVEDCQNKDNSWIPPDYVNINNMLEEKKRKLMKISPQVVTLTSLRRQRSESDCLSVGSQDGLTNINTSASVVEDDGITIQNVDDVILNPEEAEDQAATVAMLQQFMGDNSDLPADMSTLLQLTQDTSPFGGNPNAAGVGTWRLIGVDPVNSHIDGHPWDMLGKRHAKMSITHTTTPLIGSICGTRVIHAMNCEPLNYGYHDISHFGMGSRHVGKLIDLPSLYTDLYQKVIVLLIEVFVLIFIVVIFISIHTV